MYVLLFFTSSEPPILLMKPVGQLAVGIVAMLLACAVLLRLLFCLRQEGYVKWNQGLSAMNIVQKWSLEEAFVVAVIIILVISMGSSSMVEEEQYIWHFLTTTLFWILFRKTMQLLPLGDQDSLDRGCCSPRYKQVLALLVIVVSGRIIRAWHQGGVNWTQLPDISKWLEQAGTRWIKAIKVLSGILITSLSLFAFSKSRLNRCFILIVQLFFLLSGCLLLQHAIKYQDKNFLASGGDATFIAQIIYGVLGIATCFIAVASPWMFPLYISVKSSSNGQSPGSQIAENQMIHLLGGLKESSYLTGWAYMLSWSLLQLLLQQPINSMPILLLLLQISASVIYFLNDRVARKTWVEVAALYFIGMAGHFGLGNTNTLATIDVAGAFIGISSHSTLLSGILMFCITYASPMLVLLSLVMYISIEDEIHSRGNNTADIGLLLKAVLVMPLLVPLCINSVLLIAYTIILLQMRNHLFIWSVFSPKYLYVCAATVCVYIGVCIVAATEAYLYLVCSFRSRRLVVRTFTNKVTGANRQ